MNTLRPTTLNDLIGQEKTINALRILILSAQQRGDALPHCLFYGPPGLGKTTLAYAVANDFGTTIKTILGGNIKSFKDIFPTIANIQENEILFIDEIHRVTTKIAESFYTILEDFRLDVSAEDGIVSIQLPKFTIFGATTEAGTLAAPLRDRFKFSFSLTLYSYDELVKLIEINCNKLNISLSEKAKVKLAKISRGTPRIANALLEWLRDYGTAKRLQSVSESNLVDAMAMRGIDANGLTDIDRRYFNFLKKQDKPTGIDTIASSINIDKETIINVIEPFLLQKSMIQKTSKGRIVL